MDFNFNPEFRVVFDREFDNMSNSDKHEYIVARRELARKIFPPLTLVEFPETIANSGLVFSTSSLRGLGDRFVSGHKFLSGGPFVVDDVDGDGDVWIRTENNDESMIYVDPCCLFPYGGIPDAIDVRDDDTDFFAGF